MATTFSPEAFKFLRGLKRNNDREWFNARKSVYEAEIKAPMLALIGEINHALAEFAPEHVRPPHKVMFRIYRDTRFSKDKTPYKTHVGAWFARSGMEKTSGAGYYFHVAAEEIVFAAGVYMPEREQLMAIRNWMAEHHTEYAKTVKAAMKKQKSGPELGTIEPHALTRMPKGFAADHPAGELLRAHNWGVRATLPAELALSAKLLPTIVAGMKRAKPVIDLLNGAILATAAKPARPLF